MKYKSSLISVASGSLNGSTFSHNRFGAYIRNRTTPVNPSSQRQQDVRAVFTSLAADWSEVLTQAQRDAWTLYGENVETINNFGDPIHLTGINMFMRSNTVLLQAGLPQVNAGPTTFSLPYSSRSSAVSSEPIWPRAPVTRILLIFRVMSYLSERI